MAIVTVKPVEGRHVRNHQRGFTVLAAEGEPVEFDAVWSKRLAEGDVEIVPGEGAPEAAPPAASKKSR